MKMLRKFFWLTSFILVSLFPGQTHAKAPNGIYNAECIKHNIQLQVADFFGYPVANTEFWITLNIYKEGPRVTIQLPLINFETVGTSDLGFIPPVSGGFLITSDGFLPRHLSPNDLVYRTWFAGSNNGQTIPVSFSQDFTTIPPPIAGYMLQITDAGALIVQGLGTVSNYIPGSAQIMLPTDITYFVEPKVRLKNNTVLSNGPTNTTQFANVSQQNNALRDTHFNDAFEGLAAWAWSDNSMIADKTESILNLMVVTGKLDKNGKLKVRKPIQLTNLPDNVIAWNTAVAINRTNKNNIVVSYGVLDRNPNVHTSIMYRAVSFDGGKTWPENGPTNIQPTGLDNAFGDNRGVAADIYGNIWYLSTNLNDNAGNLINQPFFAISTDGGVNFQVAYTFPLPAVNFIYDYPQFCFGGDGFGNYGIQFTADYINNLLGDIVPFVGFIPISGLGSYSTPSTATLNSFLNTITFAGITASLDGRVWNYGIASGESTTSFDVLGMTYKSPGSIDLNYAGVWNYALVNVFSLFINSLPPPGGLISQPVRGYLFNSIQSNLYDDKRQALYGLVAERFPNFSQNMRLSFAISRDNAQTWSNAIDISSSDFANRGFQSMALDTARGDLYFGWYDGRHDPTFESVEYYATVIPRKQLNKLVDKIPLSNPIYSLPSATIPPTDNLTASIDSKKNKIRRRWDKN